jgi:hypothetical protein
MKRKAATSAISATPKGKKIKVLTHRPRYIKTARVPKLANGSSSVAEPENPGAKGESAEVPKVMGQEKAESAEALKPKKNWSKS